MFDRCFRCGQTGHTRSQCPQKKQHPAALATPAAHTWKPPPPPVERHAYPDDHPLNYACGFCGAGYHQACVNVGTGKSRPPHFTRIDAVQPLA